MIQLLIRNRERLINLEGSFPLYFTVRSWTKVFLLKFEFHFQDWLCHSKICNVYKYIHIYVYTCVYIYIYMQLATPGHALTDQSVETTQTFQFYLCYTSSFIFSVNYSLSAISRCNFFLSFKASNEPGLSFL